MPKFANKLITNFSGGMNDKTNPLILRESESELILNYKLDIVGSLTKRNGYDVFASQPAEKRVLGLFQYTNTATSAETTQIMAQLKSDDTATIIYYNNAGTWTSSKNNDTAITTVTNFNRYRFATFIDYVFRVNGTDAVASSINVNGGSWGTTNCPTTILPAFIAVFTDRVYVANDRRSGANNHGSRLYYSSLPSAGTITWDTANDFIDVNPDDGDEITGLENNGNRLLIFKNRALYRWQFGQTEPDRLIGVGTESQECVKTNLDLGITFFANSNGVYAYSGERPILISRKIQKWIDAVPAADWNDVCAEVDADHYYLYLSDSMSVSEAGDRDEDRTFTNVMAVYTISLDAWTIYTLNAPWRTANKLIQSNAENIYFGSDKGRTYQWDSGLTDDSGGAAEDAAVQIYAEFISKEVLLTHPNKTTVKHIDFLSSKAVTASGYYQADREGDFKPLIQLTKRFSNSKNIGKECRSMRIKITDSGAIASRIDGINIEHLPREERK